MLLSRACQALLALCMLAKGKNLAQVPRPLSLSYPATSYYKLVLDDYDSSVDTVRESMLQVLVQGLALPEYKSEYLYSFSVHFRAKRNCLILTFPLFSAPNCVGR